MGNPKMKTITERVAVCSVNWSDSPKWEVFVDRVLDAKKIVDSKEGLSDVSLTRGTYDLTVYATVTRPETDAEYKARLKRIQEKEDRERKEYERLRKKFG